MIDRRHQLPNNIPEICDLRYGGGINMMFLNLNTHKKRWKPGQKVLDNLYDQSQTLTNSQITRNNLPSTVYFLFFIFTKMSTDS